MDLANHFKQIFLGSNYNLQPLMSTRKNYFIKDGDIPCTPEIEPTFSYVWNLCSPVLDINLPSICRDAYNSKAAVIQYLNNSFFKECFAIGKYNPEEDDLEFSLLDPTDPAKGVSMTYPLGDKCQSGQQRSATIDVVCKNTKATVKSANEPTHCNYHLTMESYYGCPTVRIHFNQFTLIIHSAMC
jgi:hypothetical protein